jgi:hypothetical protein
VRKQWLQIFCDAEEKSVDGCYYSETAVGAVVMSENAKKLKMVFELEYKAGYRQGHFVGFWDYEKSRSSPKHYRALQTAVYMMGYGSGLEDGRNEWKTGCNCMR